MSLEEESKAQQRLQVILEQLGGRLTSAEAAGQLGVSRKTFYEWREKALRGMEAALGDGEPGRPPNPVDPEKEALRERDVQLQRENDVLRCRLQILNELHRSPESKGSGWKKKE
ncbi:MAG: helix-turn-helix domain-containing protein [Lentisphaerae bacterium]|nr:helix-turn-helix domain-containing protein [Lentisphaerota bacterium]